MLLYSLGLTLALVVSSPWWLLRMATTERYREGLGQRLGAVPAALRGVAAGRRVVWVHAVSVGEVLAASRLVGELEAALGDGWMVVVSTTTRTGQALARERFGAERVFYMPLDFAWAVRAYLRVLRPAALVLMESELWPRMLHECGQAGVPVAVVNARVSDRSFARGMRFRAVWGWALRKVSVWLAQSEEDARRLVTMGACGDAVRVAGNLKYDVRAPKASRVAGLIKEAAGGRPIVVAGSTVGGQSLKDPNEEEMVLNAWQDLPQRESTGVMVVLAPRHPERFAFAASIVSTFYAEASELESLRGPNGFQIEYDVIVLDTIGDLAAVYGVADIAFVGGSLVKRGGHNPLEPAQFGVPVVMGPSYENFRDVVERMKSAGGIAVLGETAGLSTASAKGADSGRDDSSGEGAGESQCRGLSTASLRDCGRADRVAGAADSGEALQDMLRDELVRLLTDREAARAMGERGRAVFEQQQGATARTVVALVEMIRPGAKA